MENFNWERFTKKIAIKAKMIDLYNAWTIPTEIENWFLSSAKFETASGKQVKRNENIQAKDRYHWSWYLYDVVETGLVIKANGKDHIQFTFAGESIVDVTFKQNQEDVIVELTQSNIPTDNQSK